jgi:uncharacterized protein (TIGR02246 family)
MTKIILILSISLLAIVLAWTARGQHSAGLPGGIQQLHQDDIAATIGRDADALTALWDDDAVLLQPRTPPIVGKAAFHDFMTQALAKSPSVKVVKYVPDIRDVQVAGNVAYEWGYFDASHKGSDQQAAQNLHAKLLRVMKRQPDGSWKFTRVMWFPD